MLGAIGMFSGQITILLLANETRIERGAWKNSRWHNLIEDEKLIRVLFQKNNKRIKAARGM
jgi:hypothetical protein